MRLYDLRVTVERIEGRSVCGLEVGDCFEVTESSRIRIPDGKHFCIYALQSVLPLLPAKQRRLPAEDWLEQDMHVCRPDRNQQRTGSRPALPKEHGSHNLKAPVEKSRMRSLEVTGHVRRQGHTADALRGSEPKLPDRPKRWTAH